MTEPYRRKSPEEILRSILKLRQGRLKVYIGAVSGSGKTYHMLREGQSLKRQGIDVVISAVSTMQRPDTVEQARDLERVPSIHWFESGNERKDLDLERLLRRNPEVLLVDGLAHRNRKGARFETRLEDIRFLLSHGISVITTINAYELRDVGDIASRLTGVTAGYSLPADTLESADEVVLIDVTPETMLERVQSGLLAGGDAWERGNLAVLRELTLRLVAEGVNSSLERHRRERGLTGPSGAAERILVAAQYHWNGSIYMRRGQQIAKRLNGELLVVTFVKPGSTLGKEQAAFRSSLQKLAERIGATLEELPLRSRRKLAGAILTYALDRHVTRIVLGHSKQTRSQELWQGSVIHDLLRQMRGVDLLVVADRTAHNGERIIPARIQPNPPRAGAFQRLSGTELDERIEQAKRGRFKMYIGAAPGVGKTYTMLREGGDLRRKGLDVIVGLLETHGRAETQSQVGELEVMPRKTKQYRGTRLEEMDTDEILRRKPDVVLVDELAHTNVPGSRNKKRYEDVLDILSAGISVITTVNVQHLESLNDAVLQVTGVRVRETVPDRILQLADEVQLIDVTPETLQQRMREGKIYASENIQQALGSFFKTGNLIALRELALREIADDVDERLESLERSASLRGPWRREEVIYVLVGSGPESERIIRRGFRIAYRLKAAWYVTPLPDRSEDGKLSMPARRDPFQAMTERLGGIFRPLELQGKQAYDLPALLIAAADEVKATQLIIAQPPGNGFPGSSQMRFAKQLLRRARHMDVLVISDGGR